MSENFNPRPLGRSDLIAVEQNHVDIAKRGKLGSAVSTDGN